MISLKGKMGDLDTLSTKSKKKKNIIVFAGIGAISVIILVSVISAFLEVNDKKIYKNRVAAEQVEGLQVIQNPEFKETWAISMENRIERQEKKTAEVIDQLASKQEVAMNELKDLIKGSVERNSIEIKELSSTVNSQIENLKEEIESKMNDQNSKIEDINVKNEEFVFNQTQNNDSIVGSNLLPNELAKGEDKVIIVVGQDGSGVSEKKEPVLKSDLDRILEDELSDVSSKVTDNDKLNGNSSKIKEVVEKKKKRITILDVDTSFNKDVLMSQTEMQSSLDEQSNSEDDELKSSFHLSTGLTQAYMITGAYAPAFQDSDSEPLPVLFEAEGDIILSNDQTATVEKCLFLGSAKGNMNSQTASIKLASISCLLSDSKYRIEGPVNGWVIGENGIPGIHGELLHKNGAWLARTFVSGFLETFSSALSGTNTTTIQFGGESNDKNSPGSAISDNIGSATAQGAATVFGKIGDYYLKMAEQIFPIIEVKGGRTVDIMLIGEQDLTLVENNKLDINSINDAIERSELKKSKKIDTIDSNNAFTRTVLKGSENNGETEGVIK